MPNSDWASSGTPGSASSTSSSMASDAVARQGANLIKNGNSEDTAATGYEAAGQVFNAANAYQGSGYRLLNSSTTAAVKLQITPLMPCVEGERFYMEAFLRTGVSNHGGTGSTLVARFWNTSKASVGSAAGNPVTVNTPFTKTFSEFTVPAGIGAVWISFELYTYTDPTGPHGIIFDNLYAERIQAATQQINSVDYLTNQDKIQLLKDWNAELQIQTNLDAQATSILGASSSQQTAYDNAISTFNSNLIASGAPSNWATTWPDGTTLSSTSIMTNLRTWWTSIATNREALQKAIKDKIQANAAYADALARSSYNLIKNGNSADTSAASSTPEGAWLANVGATTVLSPAGWLRRATADGSGNATIVVSDYIPCVAGDQFYATCQAAYGTAVRGSLLLNLAFYDGSKNYITSSSRSSSTATSGKNNAPSTLTVQTDSTGAPSGSCYVRFYATVSGATAGDSNNFNNFYATRMIARGMLQGDAIQTTNYTEDGSGNPTAGAKLSIASTALKVVAGGMQIGTYIFTDYFFRTLQALDGSNSGGRTIYRGNVDTTTRGGAPNIGTLTVTPTVWDTGRFMVWLDLAMQPTGVTDNLDAMRRAEIQMYRQSALGTTGTLTAAGPVFKMPITDRLYGNFPTDSSTSNLNTITAQIINANLSSGAPAAKVTLYNAYGASDTNCFYAGSTWAAGSSLTNNGTTWPAGLTGGTGGGTGGGGGGGGGGCPAPWVQITLASGLVVNAADLYEGAQVAGVDEVTLDPSAGVVSHLQKIWRERFAVVLEDGRAPEFSRDHRLAVTGRGWVAVQQIQPGDVLVSNHPAVVQAVESRGLGIVVSFTVDGCHTYITDGLLSHNAKVLTY